MLVQDVMTRSVVTVDSAANAQFALELLRNGGFRHLPVMQGGQMIGIVSDRDLVRTGGHILKDVMHTPVLTVSPTTPVEVAARILADNKIGALPVTDPPRNRLVGIVSQTDLFVVLARLLHGDGPSTRLELQLANLPRDLAVVTSIAEQRGVPITSLVTIPPTHRLSEWHTVVVRIGTIDPRGFLHALRDAGIHVVDGPACGPR